MSDKEWCPSRQFRYYNHRARNPKGTCMVCGKHVKATKSGRPYKHKRVVK